MCTKKNKLMSHGGVDSLEIGHANRLVDSSSSDTLRHSGLFTGDFVRNMLLVFITILKTGPVGI